MTDKLRDAAQKALARMEQDYDIACETEEGGEASEYCVGLLSDISALRAALTQQDAQAWQAAKWEAIRAVQHQYLGIVKAATNLLAEIDARHDNADAPLKYAVPYGAVTALREALTAKPLAQQDAQAVAQGWRVERVSDDDVRVYGPDAETWLLRANPGKGTFEDFAHRFCFALASCPQPSSDAHAVPQGWKLVPVEALSDHIADLRRCASMFRRRGMTATADETIKAADELEAMLNAAPTPPASRAVLTPEEITEVIVDCYGYSADIEFHECLARAVIEAYKKKNGIK